MGVIAAAQWVYSGISKGVEELVALIRLSVPAGLEPLFQMPAVFSLGRFRWLVAGRNGLKYRCHQGFWRIPED